MKIITLLKESVSLFCSSFEEFLPFMLACIIPLAFFIHFPFPTDTEISLLSSFIVSMILLCLLYFIIHACFLLSAFYRQLQQQRLPFLKILQQSLSKIFPLSILSLALMLPVFLGALITFLITIIGGIIFGVTATSPNAVLSSTMTSASSFGEIGGLLVSGLLAIIIFYNVYLFLLYFNLSQVSVVLKNMGFWKSIQRSKELVQGHKIYVFIVFLLFYLLSYMGQQLFGDLFSLFGWLVLTPFQACLSIVLYQQLENRLLYQENTPQAMRAPPPPSGLGVSE